LVAAPDDTLRDWIGAADTLVLVDETAVTPASFGAYEVPSARIIVLYTAPEYQGEGRTSALLRRFDRPAREDRTDQLWATVPVNAVAFFERRGFERRRTTERSSIRMVVVAQPLSR
jgi:GNAT superfamily N-acetyltransferase